MVSFVFIEMILPDNVFGSTTFSYKRFRVGDDYFFISPCREFGKRLGAQHNMAAVKEAEIFAVTKKKKENKKDQVPE